ncbi:Hypothetical protein (plasmid) [Pseudomonas putida]|nr:Hypothetical protein [Pseudomonas putida]
MRLLTPEPPGPGALFTPGMTVSGLALAGVGVFALQRRAVPI